MSFVRFGVVGLLLSGCTATAVQAVVINANWSAAVSGDWDDPANWDSVSFPDNAVDTFDVTIDATGSAYAVSLDTSVTIDNLTLDSSDATINHGANTLTVLGNADLLAGTFTMDGGTLDGGTWNQSGGKLAFAVASSNTITNGASVVGDLDFDIASGRVRIEGGASFTGDANLTASNVLLVYNDTQTIDNKTINMDGNNVTFSVSGNNTLALGPGMLVRGRGNVSSGNLVSGTGQLNNNGTIRSDLAGQSLEVDPDVLVNGATGVIEATNGATIVIGSTGAGDTTTNMGDINVLNGSTMRLRGDWSNTAGTILIDGTSSLQIEGDFATSDIGSIDNSAGGSLFLESTWDNTGDSFTFDTNTSNWVMDGATISGGTLNQGVGGEGLIFGVSNANILTGGLVYNGDLDLNTSSGRVRIEGGAGFTGDANLIANNVFLIYNDTQTIDSKTINMDGNNTILSVSGTNTLTLGPGMLLRGRGDITSGTIVSGTGQLNNNGTIRSDLAGQSLEVDPDVLVNGATGVIEATNGATIVIGSTGAGDTTTNMGDINVLNGSTMRLRGDWSNTAGTILIDGTSSLQIEGDFATSDIGSIDNSAGGSLFLESTWDNAGDSFTFDANTSNWVMDGATITGGTLTPGVGGEGLIFGVSNANILTGGLVYNGDLDINTSSGRVRIEGGASFTGDANLTGNNVFLIYNDTQTVDNKTINMDGNNTTLSVSGTNMLTLGSGMLLRGRGDITSGTIVGGTGQLNNNGTIRADINNQNLTVNPSVLVNGATGIIEAVGGGDLSLIGPNTQNAGTISVAGGGTLIIGNGSDTVTNAAGGVFTATDSTLTIGGNWSSAAGTITGSNSTVNLGGSFNTAGIGSFTRTGGTVNLTGNWDNAGDSFTFDTNTGDWIMDGATITGGTLNSGIGDEALAFGVNNANIFTGGLVYNGDLNLTISSGRLRIEGGATFTGDANLTANNVFLIYNDTQTVDNKTINMDGSNGTLSVSGNHTLTLGPGMLVRGRGDVTSGTIVGGTGQLNNNGTIRADINNQNLTVNPSVLVNGATGIIEAVGGGDLSLIGPNTQNAGTISVAGGGTLVIGNGSDTVTNAAGGVFTATDSTLTIGGNWSSAAGTITGSNSTVNLGGNFNTAGIGSFTRTGGTVNLTGNWGNAGDSFTFDTNTGDWIMDGATITGGTLNQGVGGEALAFGVSNSNILTGGLVYNGDLDLNTSSGRVRIEGGAGFTGDANLTANNVFLIYNDTQTVDNKTINMDGSNGTLSVSGNHTLTLGPGMLVRGRGDVTSGTIVGGTGQLNNNGTIRADINNQNLTVNPSVLVNGATGIIEAINGGDIRVNPSTLTNLSGTTLTGGTWRVADGGLFDFDAGSIETNAAELILAGAGSVFTVISSTPIEDVLTTNASAGVLRVIDNRDYPGATAFTNAGDLELGGGTFSTVSLDNQAGAELFGFGEVTAQVASAGTVRASGGRLTLSGGLSGSGSTVIIEVGSTLDFDGSDFTDPGATFALTDGRLEGPANINLGIDLNQSGGTLAPGAKVGETQLVGAYDLAGGNLETQFGGAGNPIDLLETTGNINIALTGTSLDLRPVDAMAMGTYSLLRTTGGTLTGVFQNVTDLGIYDDLVGIQYTATEVTLTLDRDMLVGDLNFDGFVGIADLNIVLAAWNQNVDVGVWPAGDPSGDGFIGIDDLNAVLSNWNAGTPPTNPGATTIPEPATFILMGLIGMGVARRSGRA